MAFKIPPICKDSQEFPMHPECIDRLMSVSYEKSPNEVLKAETVYKEYLKSENTDKDKIKVAEKLVEIVYPKRKKILKSKK